LSNDLHAQAIVNPSNVFESSTDISGRPYMVDHKGIDGSPLLTENWGNGAIKYKNGKVFGNVALQFNLLTNELYFQRNNVTYAFTEPVFECEMNFIENEELRKIFLRSGYPDHSKRDSTSLYIVLAAGKNIHLLKYVFKKIVESNGYGSGQSKTFAKQEIFYVYDVAKGTLANIKPGKASMVEALPAYEKGIEQFADSNHSKLKNETEMIALVNELNK
jgi:hypothetical protein